VSLHLSVLNGRAPEVVVQLDRLVRSDAGLVLGGFGPEPKVNVLLETAAVGLLALKSWYNWPTRVSETAIYFL
jgi:HEAT repeat protein